MLVSLRITNVAIIDELTLELGPGLVILTGETGAGKSIILDAFAAVLGERIGAEEFIRTGEPVARVEATFSVGEHPGLEEILARESLPWLEDHTLIITREISRNGRNRCFVNDHQVALGILREIGATLVDLHGQHEHQQLLDPGHQLRMVDAFGGTVLARVRDRVRDQIRDLRAVEEELDRLRRLERDQVAERELLGFQAEEIDAAGLDPATDGDLENRLRVLANQESLLRDVQDLVRRLRGDDETGGVLPQLGAVRSRIEALADVDAQLKPLVTPVHESYYALEDLAAQMTGRYESAEFDPEDLSRVEERVGVLIRLKRKYGPELDDVLRHRDDIARRLQSLDALDASLGTQEATRDRLLRTLATAIPELTGWRRQAATALAARIRDHLVDLGMPHARLEISLSDEPDPGSPLRVENRPVRLHATGVDRISFMISVNPGEDLRPLVRVASGGELSRVMLAIKSSQATLDRVPIMVFDEIDTGIGGTTAVKVADKLRQVSRECQTLVITHLPQIACHGDLHFAVEKTIEGDRSCVRVERLPAERRVHEIARMLGGTERASIEHARSLLGLGPAPRRRRRGI